LNSEGQKIIFCRHHR